MKVEFLDAAQTELDDAVNWYETQLKDLGVQFLTAFQTTTQIHLADALVEQAVA